MNNITSILTFTAMILLSIPLGKYFSKILNLNGNASNLKDTAGEMYDLSLRNFHPNKGE